MFDLTDVGWDEALAWLRGTAAVSDEEFAALSADARKQAFWMAGISRQQVAADTLDILDTVLDLGLPEQEWKKSVTDKLAAEWGTTMTAAMASARVRLVLVNWSQNAYGEANWAEVTDPDVVELRPFLMFDAVMDSHTSEICRACDETVLRHDDPWWATHRPPMHHSCRSQVISLSERQANRLGVTSDKPDPTITGEWGGGRAYKPTLPRTLKAPKRPPQTQAATE